MIDRVKLFFYRLVHWFNQSTNAELASDAFGAALGGPTRMSAVGQVSLIFARHYASEYRKRDRIGRFAFVVAQVIQLFFILVLVAVLYGVVRGLIWLL